MLQLKKFPDITVSTREEAGESCPQPEEPSFRLLARDECSFHCFIGKGFPQSHSISRGGVLTRKVDRNSSGGAIIPKVPQISQSTPEEPDFPALPRLSRWVSTHTTLARVTALWESLQESHRSLCQCDGKPETAATAQEESKHACLHSRRGLTPLWGLQRNPKIHVSPGEDTSSAGFLPRWIQGIQSRDGIDVRKSYLLFDIRLD